MFQCMLCFEHAQLIFEGAKKNYYRCAQCSAIFLDPSSYVSPLDEKKRYEEHNNDIHDPRYQKFVEPIARNVQERFTRAHHGLDYGAGTGPVVAKLLRDKGYSVELYDPYFWNNPETLDKTYDFIICCEVMEHFHFPAKEFKLLRSLLNSGGALFCQTDVYSEEIDFKSWYYKNDPTHVFFYHAKSLAWIKTNYGFSTLETNGRLVQFSI